jgi:hypothetical protein
MAMLKSCVICGDAFKARNSRELTCSNKCSRERGRECAARCREMGRGLSRTPEYKSMSGAHYRCTSPACPAFSYYGGNGVEFRFPSAIAATKWVLANLGPRPSPEHSIDRYPDKTGHYEPGNMRWATKREQALNRDDYNKRKTHCRNGHPFDDENTLIKSNGERSCRTCTRLRMRRKRGSNPRYEGERGFRREGKPDAA